MSIVSEWAMLPSTFIDIITDPFCLLVLFGGVVLGYIIGVIPGLGPTMGMALVLGIIYKMDTNPALALLIGILVAAISCGGITACLANIPGTAAAAATVVDGYPLAQKGHGAEACGFTLYSSIFGCVVSMVIVFFIQPFVGAIALKFGQWEVFLFCLFGLIICGSLIGKDVVRGWISALLGVIFALVGCETIQSVQVFTFGLPGLMSGLNSTVAILGLFGLGEVFYTLRSKESLKVTGQTGFPKLNLKVFGQNKVNMIRSLFAGLSNNPFYPHDTQLEDIAAQMTNLSQETLDLVEPTYEAAVTAANAIDPVAFVEQLMPQLGWQVETMDSCTGSPWPDTFAEYWKQSMGGRLNSRIVEVIEHGPYFTSVGYDEVVNRSYRSSFRLPHTFGGGLYYQGTRWSGGVDYRFAGWSVNGTDATTGVRYRDTHTVNAGVQLVPKAGDVRKVLNRWAYRLGVRYSQYYMAFDGHNIDETTVTVGVGIPLGARGVNAIDVGFEYGMRGVVAPGLIRENFFRVSIGLSLFGDDYWFMKYKYD